MESVGHSLRISNQGEDPLILEKNSHPFTVRAMQSQYKVEAHKPLKDLPIYKPQKVDPHTYLGKLVIDPDNVVSNLKGGAADLKQLDDINKRHHVVFDSDLSVGYNGSSLI